MNKSLKLPALSQRALDRHCHFKKSNQEYRHYESDCEQFLFCDYQLWRNELDGERTEWKRQRGQGSYYLLVVFIVGLPQGPKSEHKEQKGRYVVCQCPRNLPLIFQLKENETVISIYMKGRF